jgi:drug/metabolite transporter (DMT)-like permease
MTIATPATTAIRDPAGGSGPIIAYIALCCIWGSTYLAIRMAVETLPPHIMVGVRSVMAGMAMGVFALARGAQLPRGRHLASAAISGILLFAGGQSLLALAETRLGSGPAAVLNATQALIMPLTAWAIGAGRAPGRPTWLGLLAGFIGVAILVRPGLGGLDIAGAACVLGSVLCWSFGGAITQRWPVGPVAVTAGTQMVIGGMACLLLSLVFGDWHGFTLAGVGHRSWIGFAYLATVGSLGGFGAFAWLVQIWPMERLATYTYINPVVALLLGAALAGETITPREIVATLVILSAVGVVMWSARRRR